MESTNSDTTGSNPLTRSPSILYTSTEVGVGLVTVIGNALVIYVFVQNRNIRRYCNYYIVSLAVADLLVGIVGIPFAILLSIGYPEDLYGCLFTVSTLMGLCYVSIVCLVGVSLDRFWAITNPFAYYRKMNTTKAVGMVGICWTIGTVLGFIPIFGWYNAEGWKATHTCYVRDVVDYKYLAFICFSAIVVPSVLLSTMYGYVYCIVKAKISQMNENNVESSGGSRRASLTSNRDMVFCILKQGEAKAAMKLGILVIAFVVCWLPLYAINTVQAFCPDCPVPETLLNFTIVLSHANSALNPFLYAYHLKDFRITMGRSCMEFYRKVCCRWRRNKAETNPVPGLQQETHESHHYMSHNLTQTQAGMFSIGGQPLTRASLKVPQIKVTGLIP